ncbi:MAG TPA: ABC transporter ATP-binding protein [Thermoplasmata archaeon]|nr:ABC transporter ATP-binding protein [Thermoplasmata archaeon]
MTDAAVVTEHVAKRYKDVAGTKPALEDVSLAIRPGRIYGLIGPNGAGKTTLVRICATQLMPSAGRVEILGFDAVNEPRKVRERIAVVPQESRPLYFLNVDELVYLHLKMRGMDGAESRRRTDAVLEELDLASVRKRLVSRLSGGMRRRAMVAMVLASDADVLFLDEPTTGLDPLARREVWEAVRRTVRENRTVILTTHYLDEAEQLAGRIALLDGGKVRLEGTPEEIRGRVRYPYRVSVESKFARADLEPYGEVSEVDGGHLVFTREAEARELAMRALSAGAKVSMGPVSLEDVFLQVVGHRIDDETLPESAQ